MGKKAIIGGEQNASADVTAFRAAVRDVKPLVQQPTAAGLSKPKTRARPRRPKSDTAENIDETMPLIAAAPAEESGADPMSFQRAGVRIQVMRRLRRGLYPIEDELDLHGLNQAAARDRLFLFSFFAPPPGP